MWMDICAWYRFCYQNNIILHFFSLNKLLRLMPLFHFSSFVRKMEGLELTHQKILHSLDYFLDRFPQALQVIPLARRMINT